MTNEMVDTLGYPKQPNIVSEVTSVLREWGAIWKKLYVVSYFLNSLYNIYVFI